MTISREVSSLSAIPDVSQNNSTSYKSIAYLSSLSLEGKCDVKIGDSGVVLSIASDGSSTRLQFLKSCLVDAESIVSNSKWAARMWNISMGFVYASSQYHAFSFVFCRK